MTGRIRSYRHRRPDAWMPFYVGDYLRDTGHLSAAEHGAYMLLLIQAWTRGGRLPAIDEHLLKLTRMTPREWRQSRSTILAFFDRDGDAYVQRRLEREITKVRSTSDARRAAAQSGVSKRRKLLKAHASQDQDVSICSANGVANNAANVRHQPGQPQPQPYKEERVLSDSPLAPTGASSARSASSAEFERWWQAYPRKVGKDAARKAFDRAVRSGATPGTLLFALTIYPWPDDLHFTPHPSTWLNQGRWKDDPSTVAPAPSPIVPFRGGARVESLRGRAARMRAEGGIVDVDPELEHRSYGGVP
jgi:uncharacterized protein YdaU (DUF1376 family)